MKLMGLAPSEASSIEQNEASRLFYECQDRGRDNEVKALLPGSRKWDKTKRWIIKRVIISKKHPMTKICLKSTSSIDREIIRHIKNYSNIIHPFSEFRIIWIKLMMIISIICLFVFPFYLCFFIDQHDYLIVLSIIDLGLFFDTFLCFFTGYLDPTTRAIVLDQKIVTRKYLSSFFILDFVSGIPFALIFIIFSDKSESEFHWACFYLLKILRLRNVVVYFDELSELYELSFRIYKIIKMTMIIIVCIHWATCLELYAPVVGKKIGWNKQNRSSWLESDYMKERKTIFKRYVASANRAAIALASSSHYLDVKTIEDILLNLFLTVLGRIGYIYVLAQFFQLMATYNSSKKRKVKLLQQLQEYMEYKELPHHIQQRLLTYYNYWCEKGFERDKFLLSNVSPHLKEALLLHTNQDLIKNVDFFKYLPQPITIQLANLLITQVYLKNDYLVKQGTIGDAMYYIVSGHVSVSTKNYTKVCHLEEGSYFGEMSLVIENQQRLASVQALETCEVRLLKQSDFLRVISPYPNLLRKLQKSAVESLDKSLLREKIIS